MDVKNCRKCRKLFNYIGGPQICPQCKEDLEKKFQEVKAFIQDNRNATVIEVAEACEVEEGQIRQWVREERLMFSDASASGILCESCGTPIASGRFCDKCKVNMINDLSSVGRKPVVQEKPAPSSVRSGENKMRFLNK